MVASEFFNLIEKFNVFHTVSLEDFADKLNSVFTVIILTMCVFIVTIKSYVIKPIACFANVIPSGGNFLDYLENYCWVHGTINLLPNEKFTNNESQWDKFEKTHKINYYQWIPFILGLQCIMFYIPRFIWQIFCFNKGGTSLETIVKLAVKISEKPMNERQIENENIAKIIENMLVLHRDFRNNKVASIRRYLFTKCNLLMNSKRLGTMLVFWYFFIKFLYLVNGIGQLIIIQHILGFYNHIPSFGYNLFWYIISGTELEIPNYFPRLSFCYLKTIRHVGSTNYYIAQCVLPINMLNEKIYTFLWCWILLVTSITFLSIPLWMYRLYRADASENYVKHFLQMVDSYEENKMPTIHKFIKTFLRRDGIFLLRMISNNAGDLIASPLVNSLWEIYLTKYQNRNLQKDIFSISKQIKTNENNFPVVGNPNQKSFNGSPLMHYL